MKIYNFDLFNYFNDFNGAGYMGQFGYMEEIRAKHVLNRFYKDYVCFSSYFVFRVQRNQERWLRGKYKTCFLFFSNFAVYFISFQQFLTTMSVLSPVYCPFLYTKPSIIGKLKSDIYSIKHMSYSTRSRMIRFFTKYIQLSLESDVIIFLIIVANAI